MGVIFLPLIVFPVSTATLLATPLSSPLTDSFGLQRPLIMATEGHMSGFIHYDRIGGGKAHIFRALMALRKASDV